MKTERLQNIPQDVEMGHIPLLNAAQSRSAEPTFAPSHSRDTLVGTTQAGRMKKRLLTAAAMGGALLGGSLSAAVAAPLMKHQRNQALQLRNEALAQLAVSQSHYNTLLASNAELDARLQAALAPTPTNPPESRAASTPPVFVVDTRCVAAERPVNQTATDALMAPSDGSSPTFVGHLYNGSMPKPEDIASLAADYSGGNIGSHAGVARAGVLLSLAATDPGYIKDMIQPLSDTSYAVRLYDLNEQTGDFNAVNVRVDSNEILLDAGRFKSGSPMWWSVILRAGQELDQYLGYQATTTLAGDSSDNAAPVRQGIGSVVGAHTETVSMDEYATLSNLEVSRGILSSNATVALYYARTSLSTSLMQAKNDNWPAYIDLLRDKRNIGLVRLHDVSDLQHIASDGVVHAPSGASITLLGHNSGASNRMSIAVPGQDSVTVDSGFWSKLIVTGMEKNAVWLQPGFDYVVRDPLAAQYKPFKMPLDLLQLATAELSLTRRSCESDAAFVQLPSSTF